MTFPKKLDINWLSTLVRSSLNRLGVDVRRSHPDPHLQVASLPDVDVVIDVGVAEGTAWLYDRYHGRPTHLVDPLPLGKDAAAFSTKSNVTFHQAALGSGPGTLNLTIDRTEPSKSSFLDRTELSSPEGHSSELVAVPVTTLDDLFGDLHSSGLSLALKVDTEGFELEVLRGAESVLEDCQVVVVECSIRQRFRDSYTPSQLISFLHDRGFKLSLVLDAPVDPSGSIRYVDLAFTRPNED